ncbi:MAG: SAF domain-containing protein, partial [Gemmatimonadota bacterium]
MTWSTLHWYGLVAFALVVSAPSIAIAQVDGVVPVATRDLARGTVLTAEDFRLGDAAETAS